VAVTGAGARHVIEPTRDTTVHAFDRDAPPALTAEPGDIVVVGSLDASGHLSRQRVPGEDRPRMFETESSRGHCLTGPIAVTGAMPGMVLAVSFVSLRPAGWGFTAAGARDNRLTRRLGLAEGPPSWLLWEIDAEAGIATCDRGYSVAIAPFLGVVGLPPAEPGQHCAWETGTPPRGTARSRAPRSSAR
jgi:acetamidase/formamidase